MCCVITFHLIRIHAQFNFQCRSIFIRPLEFFSILEPLMRRKRDNSHLNSTDQLLSDLLYGHLGELFPPLFFEYILLPFSFFQNLKKKI